MSLKIISVHVPRTGGTSLRRSLLDAYGPASVVLDYIDDPLDPCCLFNLDPESCTRLAALGLAPDIRVVHGHFHPAKYREIEGLRIAFLRHPIEILISTYHYWHSLKTSHYLYWYVRTMNLSLLEMARIPSMRYLLSKSYFGGVEVESFDFVGFMDSYSADVHRLGAMLSVDLGEHETNGNALSVYLGSPDTTYSDRRVIDSLKDCLVEDIKLYDRFRSVHFRRGR